LKTDFSFAVGLFSLAVFLSVPSQVCRAQIIVGGATNQTASPLTSVPATGTFFSAQLNVPPWPLDWLPGAAVYPYGSSSNVFIIDDRGWDYSASGNAMFAATPQAGGMGAMLAGGVPQPGGTNSGSGGAGPRMPLPNYSAEDLYLTNFAVNGTTNSMMIHPPASQTNGVYDLVYTTNLSPPISWQWLLTAAAPGPTLLTVTNATDPQRFYELEGLTNSSAGTDIWLAFMDTFATAFPATYTLSISAQETCTGMVTIPVFYYGYFTGFATSNFSLAAGTVTNITIQDDSTIPDDDDVEPYGIHITASQPVSVYGLCYYPAMSWGFTGWPTPMLGTNYCVLARPSLYSQVGGGVGYSQFAILGTASNTTVHILPSATANLATNTGSNSLFTMTLQPGSTYQIESLNNTNDVTGTWITSDKPIAVFAGASTACVPDASGGPANPLVQELLPVAEWGNGALSLSFGRPGGDSYRVLSATNAAVVITTTNGALTTNLVGGQPYDIILDGPVEFQANNPIQVAQIAQGGYNDPNVIGDPCEILLPPTGHYLTSCTVSIPTNDNVTGDFVTNFLNLIVPRSAILTTMMDGTAITNFVTLANFGQVGSSAYSAARIPVAPGSTHRISSSQPTPCAKSNCYPFG
jgi:hypothetical protein